MNSINWNTDFHFNESVMNLTEKADYWPIWILSILGISCLLIVIVRLIHPGYYLVLFSASVRNINIDLYAREGLSNSTLIGILLHFNFVLILSTLITLSFWDSLSVSNTFQMLPLETFAAIFLSITVFTIFRYIMLGIIKKLTQVSGGIVESIYNIKVKFEITSLILSFILLLHFTFKLESNFIQYTIIITLLLINILYWIWSFRHAIRSGISWLYLFLYLCTLEILPLVAFFLLLSD